MTVIVVSLFLPYTIHFDLPKPETRPPLTRQSSRASVASSRRGPSLFDHGTTGQQFSIPSDASTIDEGLFPIGDEKFGPRPSDVRNITDYLVPSDSQPPMWGRGQGHFIQPKSRARSPPPVSVLDSEPMTRPQTAPLPMLTLDVPPRRRNTEKLLERDAALIDANWSVQRADQGNGALRNAIQVASASGLLANMIWIGTLGMPTDALEVDQMHEIGSELESRHGSIWVLLNDNDFDSFYAQYCKVILWPVFHYQIPDSPKSKAYEDHSWKYYEYANKQFAERICEQWKKNDMVWIHDYHLLLVPRMVRDKIPAAQIGFFFHVAFPSSEVFRCLAMREKLLQGVLGANLIGFQTQEHCNHFLETCARLLRYETTAEGVQLTGSRFVNVAGNLPIGIDTVPLKVSRGKPEVLRWIDRLRNKYFDKRLIVSRDKLDGVAGIRQKLLAFELYLNMNPHEVERTVLLQVATSTTERAELDSVVTGIVNRINSIHSTLAHQPLVYLEQDIDFAQYLALITVADVLFVTSLREGMNLASHEFIACQDGAFTDKKHGSLILSEFTGSASIFKGDEISVNPWDYRQCSLAIKTALEMPPNEREIRWTKLNDTVNRSSGETWANNFLSLLGQAHAEHTRQETSSIPRLSIDNLSCQILASCGRLYFLGLEGTLCSFDCLSNPTNKKLHRVKETLRKLLQDNQNYVYIMSKYSPEDLDRLFKTLPTLGLIAENGCFIKEARVMSAEWTDLANTHKMTSSKNSIREHLEYYRERTPGSWIEERHFSFMFHHETAEDVQAAKRQLGDMSNLINDSYKSQDIHAIPIDGGLLIEPINCERVTAVSYAYDQLTRRLPLIIRAPDFFMAAGSGREDEKVYMWARILEKHGVFKYVTTVSAGTRKRTKATTTVTQGAMGVLYALSQVAVLPTIVDKIERFREAIVESGFSPRPPALTGSAVVSDDDDDDDEPN